MDSNSEGNPAGVPIRTNWLAVGLELLPLAAPLLLLAVGLGFFVAFVAGLGWARIGRANIGVTYATARGTLMAVLFLVVVWAVLAHGSDDARATIPFWILAALWAIPPMISSAIVAVVSRRPERPPVPVPHNN